MVRVARESIEVTAAPLYDDEQRRVWLEAFSEERMGQFVDDAHAFVATCGPVTAGFSGLVVRDDGDGLIEFLHVRPAFAGQGAARQLVAAVEEAAREQALARLWADASLLARPVLEHLGYAVIEDYHKHVRGVTFENAWVRKTLE